MDISNLMILFVRAVEQGSFSAAGRALELSPSAVSRQMAALEDHLGVRLLNRSSRRLSLTEEGRAFHERCRQSFWKVPGLFLLVPSLYICQY